jgi:hypothetical protein
MHRNGTFLENTTRYSVETAVLFISISTFLERMGRVRYVCIEEGGKVSYRERYLVRMELKV